MKKINMLIAVFAVIAAASAAKAGDFGMSYDGKRSVGFSLSEMKGQTGLETLLPEDTTTGYAVSPEAGSPDLFKSLDTESFKGLAGYYKAQKKIKDAVAEYYKANSNGAAAAALAPKSVRIAAKNGVVYVVSPGEVTKLNDIALAGTIKEIAQAQAELKIADLAAGSALVIGCMTNDKCWEGVGAGV